MLCCTVYFGKQRSNSKFEEKETRNTSSSEMTKLTDNTGD